MDDLVAFNRASAKTHSGIWRDLGRAEAHHRSRCPAGVGRERWGGGRRADPPHRWGDSHRFIEIESGVRSQSLGEPGGA